MSSSGTIIVLDSSTRHFLFILTVTWLVGSGYTYKTVYALTKHAQLGLIRLASISVREVFICIKSDEYFVSSV